MMGMFAGSSPGIGISVAEVNWIVTVEAEFESGPAPTEVVREIGLVPVQVVAPLRLMLLVN